MKDLKQTSKLVKMILEEDKKARNSDQYLYLKVLKYIEALYDINISNMTVEHFLANTPDLPCPNFETVRRTRQKVQAQFPELAANRRVAAARAENEEVFREFATGAGVLK